MTRPETVEALAEHLNRIHFDGTGCGTTGVNGCSNCCGPSPMSAHEIAEAILNSSAMRDLLATERDRERADWSSWLDGRTGAVGPRPPTVEDVARALREGPRPFGVAANREQA